MFLISKEPFVEGTIHFQHSLPTISAESHLSHTCTFFNATSPMCLAYWIRIFSCQCCCFKFYRNPGRECINEIHLVLLTGWWKVCHSKTSKHLIKVAENFFKVPHHVKRFTTPKIETPTNRHLTSTIIVIVIIIVVVVVGRSEAWSGCEAKTEIRIPVIWKTSTEEEASWRVFFWTWRLLTKLWRIAKAVKNEGNC